MSSNVTAVRRGPKTRKRTELFVAEVVEGAAACGAAGKSVALSNLGGPGFLAATGAAFFFELLRALAAAYGDAPPPKDGKLSWDRFAWFLRAKASAAAYRTVVG